MVHVQVHTRTFENLKVSLFICVNRVGRHSYVYVVNNYVSVVGANMYSFVHPGYIIYMNMCHELACSRGQEHVSWCACMCALVFIIYGR